MLEVRRHCISDSLRGWHWRGLKMLGDHLHRRVALEDLLAGEQVVGHAPERVDVRASIHAVAERHLGGHVAWRPQNETGLGGHRVLGASVSDGLHEAEVEDFDKVVDESEPSNMNIRRLDVPMHQAAGVGLGQ